MYEEHPVFEPPGDETAKIWRYLDLTKFVSMLQTRSLYFPRADLLGDPHEGTLHEETRRLRNELVDDTPGTAGQPWEWAVRIVPGAQRILVARSAFLSCWNLSEYENAALWSVYGKAIAIESTFAALRDCLRSATEPIYIGSVKYVDYETGSFPIDNLLRAIAHKRNFFENERELRAVIPGDPTFSDWHWTEGSSFLGDRRPGIPVPVDLKRLVSQVWIAPPRGGLLETVVRGLLEQYELPVKVRHSNLDDFPWRIA